MEPSLEQTNSYRPPKKSKALIAFAVFCGVIAVAGITFSAYVAFQSYEKMTKISEIESKVAALETRIDDLVNQQATIPTNPIDGTITYEVLGEYEDDSSYPERGFYIEESSNNTKVTIAMGEQSTGGHRITIDRIDIINDEAAIYVTEVAPAEDESAATSLTYPTAVVEFNRRPSNITVQTTTGGEEYLEISTGTTQN